MGRVNRRIQSENRDADNAGNEVPRSEYSNRLPVIASAVAVHDEPYPQFQPRLALEKRVVRADRSAPCRRIPKPTAARRQRHPFINEADDPGPIFR